MTDTSKKPREIWCLSNFNVTTQMPDGQVQDIRIAVKELKNSIINGEVTKLIPLSEYQSLKEQCEKLEKALEFYADLNNFGKTVWENDERDGHCWYENFDNYEIGEIYGHNSTGDFGIKAEEALQEFKKFKGEL